MLANGYSVGTDEDSGDIDVVIYSPKNGEWVSIASDAMQFKSAEDTRSEIEPFSTEFKTDAVAMACFDSDYAFMNLLNAEDKTDAWINVGEFREIKKPRRTSIASLKRKVSDYDRLKNALKREFVFAEEILSEVAELLGMQEGQVLMDTDRLDEQAEREVIRLSFIDEGIMEKKPPVLQIPRFKLIPCIIDESNFVYVNNRGRKSKGVGIMFHGDYVENGELSIENVTLEAVPRKGKGLVIPVELEKAKCSDGTTVLYREDRNFPIPPAVSTDIPIMRYMKLEFEREFGVRFTVKGNPRKVLDVKVMIIPLENPEGQDCWYVYKFAGSKENYIKAIKEKGYYPSVNPEDYDI
jgi:hypothetical protein